MALKEKLLEVNKDKINQNLMGVIKRMHSIVENTDIDKHRQSQDNFGAIFGASKEITHRDFKIEDMDAEIISVARGHMRKYVILYCHGGGYMTGSFKYARSLTTKLATSTSMDVLSFDYRLAPEHPYPAALEDAMKAWNYLMLLGYGARDIIIGGDSAGGNLALALTLKLKEEERLLPRGLFLMSPWTDLTAGGKSHETRAAIDPVLDEAYLKQATEAYASGQDLKDPLISPLFGDFKGFSPVYIQVGDNEVLLSDSKQLHQKLIHDNVSVKMDVYPGMWHVFQMSPFKTAYEAMEKNADFIFDICR